MHSTNDSLEFNAWNGHLVRTDTDAYLLHVPTTAVFGVDDLGLAVIDACRLKGGRTTDQLVTELAGRFPPERIRAFTAELSKLEVLQISGSLKPINPTSAKVTAFPLSTLVLNVNTGCNLSCTYCYKEDLVKPSLGKRMDFVTAARSVDMLLKAGEQRDKINIVFFGGEPLTNVPLIKEVVDYAEVVSNRAGKRVDFSLTTNATLLTPALIDYFDSHRFGISVSMDGPQAIHDRHRKTVGGKGTYDVVARKVALLLERYRSRPVGARVTLGAGNTGVEAIHEHLKFELGFHEVGYAPVTASDTEGHALSDEEMLEVHRAFERLGENYLQHALAGRNNGFSNMHQLMTDLHEGRRKSVPCGGGVGLLAVDAEGDLNLCHRFTGSDLPTFGNVATGIDTVSLGAFVDKAVNREGTHCQTCRIRNLCSGGCYHESYARYGDPHHRTYHYCNLLRSWVDFGVRVYAQIQRANPEFFVRHLEPRSANA
ncbi:MAG: quinohemoprotein amine dehydrogenase maturation protein [Pseudomonadota bacterium]